MTLMPGSPVKSILGPDYHTQASLEDGTIQSPFYGAADNLTITADPDQVAPTIAPDLKVLQP